MAGGLRIIERGGVVKVDFDTSWLTGEIETAGRVLKCKVEVLGDGSAENHCPCHDSRERGVICIHAVALGLAMLRKANDPHREEKLKEEQRKAARLAQVDEAAFLQRVTKPEPKAVSARLRLGIAQQWQAQSAEDAIELTCALEVDGVPIPMQAVDVGKRYVVTEKEDAVLFVLEDICEGPVQNVATLNRADFTNLLSLLEGGGLFVEGESEDAIVNAARLPARLRVDLDHETGELLVMVHCELPYLQPTEFPFYVISRHGGWAYGANNFWPLEDVLPLPMQGIYDEPVVIARDQVLRFFDQELPVLQQQAAVESELSRDLFLVDPETPTFHLKLRGSPASLGATLHAVYGDVELVAGKADPAGLFCHPDPDDLMRYTVRSGAAEDKALGILAEHGFVGKDGASIEPLVGTRSVLNALGSSVPALRRLGWKVDLGGKVEQYYESIDFVTPVVHVREPSGTNWFEVGFDFEAGGESISSADVWRALRKGESYMEAGGRTVLLDQRAVESMHQVFEDCSSGEGSQSGSFRLDNIHTAYVQASLDALDGVDVESTTGWRERAEQQNRSGVKEAIELPASLAGTLRPYQTEGVQWLRFLENHGFGGILADEMGLGKTLQTLAWLQSKRSLPEAEGKPCLIVCPTSLVENWQDEAQKFVPDLSVLIMSGASRHENWEQVANADLVITSYALLRRDIETYRGLEFAAAILDEAQHIKNHSTQNAKATKQIRAIHRLVLTGTPVENSVSDLWSIMDFLMPGYLGSHQLFRDGYELPIGRGGEEGDEAQSRLRRKLKPFLLRRLKKDVATDLPPKIERVSWCRLTADQAVAYKELFEASQRKINDMVMKNGFDKSRMEILKTLLRLRQVSCHLGLLKLPGLEAKDPSGKLNMFAELLDEALDGGHRILVFSQFVSMLTILRDYLDERDLSYCYLDGSTKNRMEQVRMFNRERDIPVFLISLKAGGTGLNLTGADMVVHFDPWWNPAVEDQATDRAYRIGQKRTVYSVKLITKGTVEEKVLALQRKKKAVINATLGGDDEVMAKMDWEDIQELMGMS